MIILPKGVVTIVPILTCSLVGTPPSQVPVKVQGGWDKCYDSFTKDQADQFGIDQWECEHNCYTRTDKNGSKYHKGPV